CSACVAHDRNTCDSYSVWRHRAHFEWGSVRECSCAGRRCFRVDFLTRFLCCICLSNVGTTMAGKGEPRPDAIGWDLHHQTNSADPECALVLDGHPPRGGLLRECRKSQLCHGKVAEGSGVIERTLRLSFSPLILRCDKIVRIAGIAPVFLMTIWA